MIVKAKLYVSHCVHNQGEKKQTIALDDNYSAVACGPLTPHQLLRKLNSIILLL